jgi:hypothetical protein
VLVTGKLNSTVLSSPFTLMPLVAELGAGY